MIIRFLRVDLLLVFLAFILPACSSGLKSVPHPPFPCQPSAQSLLGTIEENSSRISALKGRANLKVVSTHENLRARCLIFIQKPDQLRLEVLNPLNMPLFLFLNNGQEWVYYSFPENRYQRDKSEDNTSLAGLKVKDIISFASGGIPLPYNGEKGECTSDRDYTLLTLSSDEGKERIWIDAGESRIVKGELYDLFGAVKLRVDFREFQRAGDIHLPRRIEIYLPENSTWITFTYEEIQVNPEFGNDLFEFTPPPSAERGGFSSGLLIPNPYSLKFSPYP